jgi:hypothetical protein
MSPGILLDICRGGLWWDRFPGAEHRDSASWALPNGLPATVWELPGIIPLKRDNHVAAHVSKFTVHCTDILDIAPGKMEGQQVPDTSQIGDFGAGLCRQMSSAARLFLMLHCKRRFPEDGSVSVIFLAMLTI